MSSEEFKKLEELLENDRKIIEENYREIERLNKRLKEIDDLVEEVNVAPLVEEDMFKDFYDKYWELKDSDKE